MIAGRGDIVRHVVRVREVVWRRVARAIARRRRGRAVRTAAKLATRSLDAWHNVDYEIAHNGEARVADLIAGRGPRTVLDVGANVGEWAIHLAGRNSEARVHCFEISAATRRELAANTAGSPNITIAEAGLDRAPGRVAVKRYPGQHWYTSIFDYPHEDRSEWSEEDVITGDAYVAERGIDSIDLLKLDAEGAEYRVLEGFAGALADGRIRTIQFEYGRANILAGVFLRDLYALLEGHGYRLGKVYPTYVDLRGYSLEDEDFRGPNYLAVLEGRRS